MKSVKINSIVYDIPESWEEVSINKWRSLRNIQMYITDDMDDEQKLTIELEIMSVLTYIPFDVLINIPGKYYKEISDSISFFHTVELTEEYKTSIVIDGEEYKLMDLTQLTLGDRANIDIIRDSSNLEDRIGRVMSILYRKDGEEELTMDQRDEKEYLFNENVSINDVYGTLIFFLTMIKEYKKNIKFSLAMKTRNELLMKMKWFPRMKMRMKLAMLNITMVWRSGYQRGESWILKKFSK